MRIAIIGFGSVGRGIAEVIAAKTTGIIVTAVADSRSGSINAAGLDVTAVLRDKQETGMCGTPGVTASDIISSDVYDVLVEVSPPMPRRVNRRWVYPTGTCMRQTCCYLK